MNKLYKVLSMSVLGLSCLSFTQIKKEKLDQKYLDKIVFENCQNILMDTDTEISEETGYCLTIKLNYPNLDVRNFDNEEEKQIEYSRQREYYTAKNNEIRKNLDLRGFEHVYVSTYSPFISIDSTYEQLTEDDYKAINKLAKNENVEVLYVNENKKAENFLTSAESAVGVRQYITNATYTGSGIVVGVLEMGIINENHSNFNNRDVTARNVWYYSETVTEHANMVASIIVGPYGIAPSCKLLSVELSGDAVSEIDWLLDNNVNIINCSYGDSNPDGRYSSKSAYMDYIAYTYKVSFVCAVGNDGNSSTNIANPALGYNALSVGACFDNNGGVTPYSSYNVVSGPRKPDLVAPGNDMYIYPFGIRSGTSFSAPMVTGCLALMMEKTPHFKYNPFEGYSSLISACSDKDSRSFGYNFDNYGGAGVLDFANFMQYLMFDYKTVTIASNASRSDRIYFFANEGDIIRIALNWPAVANGNANGTSFTDYYISLYGENDDRFVAGISDSTDNKEFLECVADNSWLFIAVIKKFPATSTASDQVSMNVTVIPQTA